MIILIGLLAALLSFCEVTGWNLDNFVTFSPIGAWLVCPTVIVLSGFWGGLDFYRRSRAAKASSSWYMQRPIDPGKWRFRLCLSVLIAMLLGGGGGVYALAWGSMLLPSTLETHVATVVSQGRTARAPPICRQYRTLQSAELGQFRVCISKPRGRELVVNGDANLEIGTIVTIDIRRSTLGVWVVSLAEDA